MGKKAEQQKKNLEQATQQASKIALESSKTIQGILSHKFTGECSQMVTQAVEMINQSKGAK